MLKQTDPKIYEIIKAEEKRQRDDLELIPSENVSSSDVREALGSIFTDKYAEGKPHARYYAGEVNVDAVEDLAVERALKMFGLSSKNWHANVQPYSGSPANLEVYFGLLEFGAKVMGMRLDQGGHITHGLPIGFSGKGYNFVAYGVNPQTEQLDYDEIAKIAKKEKPKLIVCGATAYSRIIDFKKFAAIAKSVSAYLMADVSHIAGLIAGGAHPSPFPYADVVTTTTHKTLRGPRGAIIICRKELAEQIDRAVFPGMQGGPHVNQIAAKAVCFGEALKPQFKTYACQIVKNAKALADNLQKLGARIVSNGTDNHLMLIDVKSSFNITGKTAQLALEKAGIITNKNTIPNDTEKPFIGSGIRLGTPATTSRGMKEREMKTIAELIVEVLKNSADEKVLKKVQAQVLKLTKKFSK